MRVQRHNHTAFNSSETASASVYPGAMQPDAADRSDPAVQPRHGVERFEPARPGIPAADVPKWMARNDGRGRIVELVQLCKDWACFPGLRDAMISEPPRRRRWYHRFGPRRHDLARIAAVVHALCDRDGHPVPEWVHQHRSEQPLRFNGSPLGDNDYTRSLRGIAPQACHYHNVFFDPASIEDIRVHGIRDHTADTSTV